MNATRVLATAITTTAIVLGTGAAGVAARDDTDATPRPQQTRVTYSEPSAHPIPDGKYLGYVRAAGLPDATVWVDFVSLVDGRVDDLYEEMLVYAGALASVDIVERAPLPFWILIDDGTIIELTTADDALDAPISEEVKVVGAITEVRDVDGALSVVLDGDRFELDAEVAVSGSDGGRVDIRSWLDANGSISLDRPLYVEATVADGIVVTLQHQ